MKLEQLLQAGGLLAAALLLSSARSSQEEWPELRPLQVEVTHDDGVDRATVVATNASVERVVQRLADLSNMRLTGFFADQPGTALITVDLRDRPLRQVLEYALGSVGLTYEIQGDLLTIVPVESGDFEHLEARALANYLRASRNFPKHEEAARARMSQAEIQVRSGNPTAAADNYRSLMEDYPLSPLVPDAHLAAGLVLEDLGRFEEAHKEYLELTRLPVDDKRRRDARLGLARCQLELSNPSFTILMLRNMEKNEPVTDRVERASRLLLEARALSRAGMHVETLEVLDELDRLGPETGVALEAMGVRAVALEGLNYVQPAARAWLAIARRLQGDERDAAYLRSAELTLAADQPLGVLMLAAELRSEGSSLDVASLEFRARLQLGLPIENDPALLTHEQRLVVAQADLQEGRTERARANLESLFSERSEVDDLLLTEVAVTLADLRRESAPTRANGLEQAARTLADARQFVDSQVAATELDPVAAEMFEEARDFARAAAAWEGQY